MKSRELSLIGDNPFLEAGIKRRDDFYNSDISLQSVKNRCKDEKLNLEFNEIVEKIDFNKLKLLYENDAVKSGVEPGDINFLPPSRIFNIEEDIENNEEISRFGYYNIVENYISINYSKIKESAEKLNVNPEIFLLKVIGHEESHAVSKHNIFYKAKSKSSVVLSKVQSGYSLAKTREHVKENKNHPLFNGFNEGITEIYTYDIIGAYLRENPEFSNEKQEDGHGHIRNFNKIFIYSGYATEMRLVETFMQAIAKATDCDIKDVRNAFVSGYFSGENFYDKELSESFNIIFGKSFMKGLEKTTTKDKSVVLSCIKKLERWRIKNLTNEQREKIKEEVKSNLKHSKEMEKIFSDKGSGYGNRGYGNRFKDYIWSDL